MQKSGTAKGRKFFKERRMSSVAIGSTFDLAAGLSDVLRPYTPKALAQRIGASPATVKNWKDGENGPTWRHAVAMLNDDELCVRLLKAAGREDLANSAETITALKRVIQSEGK
jgi:hypothetical protein